MSKRPDRMVAVERELMDWLKDDWYIPDDVIDALSQCEYEIYSQECQEEQE